MPADVRLPAGQEGRLVDQLRAAVRAEIAPLTDPSVTGLDRSFCSEIGVSPGWLLRVLPDEVVRAVTLVAATKSAALAPLANQLNADAILEGLAGLYQLLTDTPALSAIRSLPPDARVLDSLFMHNLIQEPSPRRYRLHDLLREYARLVAAEAVAAETLILAMERVLDMFLAIANSIQQSLASGITSRDEPRETILAEAGITSLDEARKWVELERTNLLACIAYAAQHNYPVHLYALARFIDEHLGQMGFIEDKLAVQRSVLSVARRHDDRPREARVLLAIAQVEASTDRYDPARGHFSQAQEIFAELGDRANEAECLRGIGVVGYLTGNFQQAMHAYEDVMAIQREVGSERGMAAAQVNIAGAQYMLGRLDEALENYDLALGTYRRIGDRGDIAQALLGIAIVRGLMGQPQQSLDAYYRVLAIQEALGRRLATAEAHSGIAGAEASLGNYQEALAHYGTALAINREAGGRLGEAQALLGIAEVKSELGNMAEAENYYNMAQLIYRDLGNRGGRAHTLRGLAKLLLMAGRTDEALDKYYEAKAIFHDLAELPSEIETMRQVAAAELSLGRKDRAVNGLRAAYDMLARSNPSAAAEVESELARIRNELLPPG